MLEEEELTGSSSCLKIKFVEGLTDIEMFGIITGKEIQQSNLHETLRKIEFPLPDEKTKRRIFGIHTGES